MANEMTPNNAGFQQAPNPAVVPQKKKKKTWIIILGVVIGLILIIAIASGGSKNDETPNNNNTSTPAVTAEQKEETAGKIGNYICTVKSAEICKNWDGKDAVKITYEFTNNSTDAQSFDFALNDDVYQDGIGLETSFISSDDDDFGIDVKIKPGTTKEVSKVYLLRDKETALDVEISELISFNDEKLTYTVDLK